MSKVLKNNWYGFDHKMVAKKFEGQLSFVNDFCVHGEYRPVAVYKAKKPNRSKGHKDFLLLQLEGEMAWVRGLDKKEMQEFRYQNAIHCLECDSIVYSVMRHDMAYCICGKVSIDGGKDYTKIGTSTGASYEGVILDLLTDKVKKYPRSKKKEKLP
jgi:hypothetical protein